MRKPNTGVMAIAALLGLLVGVVHEAGAGTSTVTVTNQASRRVHGLYLAATAQSGWGPDVLNGALARDDGFTLTNTACSGSFVLVAEDESGCFLYRSVACGVADDWTITETSARDCGR